MHYDIIYVLVEICSELFSYIGALNILYGPLSTSKKLAVLFKASFVIPRILFVCFRVNQHSVLLVVLPWDVNTAQPPQLFICLSWPWLFSSR